MVSFRRRDTCLRQYYYFRFVDYFFPTCLNNYSKNVSRKNKDSKMPVRLFGFDFKFKILSPHEKRKKFLFFIHVHTHTHMRIFFSKAFQSQERRQE